MSKPRHRTAVLAQWSLNKASRRQFLVLTAGAIALTSVCPDAMAQTYPLRPITMVVAFGAGGPSDIIARILAEGMRGSLGQPVVIENVPGASGTIGVGRVARAAPDGYTLVLGNWATHVLNGPMFALQYDLEKDFEPVSLVSSDPLIIVARKTMPARDLKEFIAWLKADPNSATQGTTGAGGISTVGGLFLRKRDGHTLQVRTLSRRPRCGYAGSGCRPHRFHDRHGRQFSSSSTRGHHQGVRRDGTETARRCRRYPDSRRRGIARLQALNWQAVYLPKGAATDIVAKLNSAWRALADASVRRQLADIGQEIFPRDQQTPEALRAFQRAEIEKWSPIIKAANMKAN